MFLFQSKFSVLFLLALSVVGITTEAMAQELISLKCQYSYRFADKQRKGKPLGVEAKPCHFHVLLATLPEAGTGAQTHKVFGLYMDRSKDGVLFLGTKEELLAKLATFPENTGLDEFRNGYLEAALPVYGMTFSHSRGGCNKEIESLHTAMMTVSSPTGPTLVSSYVDKSRFACSGN